MPTFEIAVAVGADDARADAQGVFSSTTAFSTVGTLSGSTDHRFYERFLNLAIPRNNKIDSAVMRVKSNGTATSVLAIEARLDASLTPAPPSDASFRTRAYTSARGAVTIPSTVVQDSFFDIDFAPALQEMVNKAGWAESGQNIGIIVQLQNPADTTPRRHFGSYEANPASAPKIIVTHSLPSPVTGTGAATGGAGAASGAANTSNTPVTGGATVTGKSGTASGVASSPNTAVSVSGMAAGEAGSAAGDAASPNDPVTAEGVAVGGAGTADAMGSTGTPPVTGVAVGVGGAGTASGSVTAPNDPVTAQGVVVGEAGTATGAGVQGDYGGVPTIYRPVLSVSRTVLEATPHPTYTLERTKPRTFRLERRTDG